MGSGEQATSRCQQTKSIEVGSDLTINPPGCSQSVDCIDQGVLVGSQRSDIESERTTENDEGKSWTPAGDEWQRSECGYSTVTLLARLRG